MIESAGARTIEVPPEAAGQRLDRWLAALPGSSTRSQIHLAIDAGYILVNGRPAKPGLRLRGGERISIESPPLPSGEPIEGPTPPLEVLYEDQALVAVNKQPGVVVHPAVGHPCGTLVDALRARYPSADWPGGRERAGIVHRLDRDTSGVLLVARTVHAHEALARQFRERQVIKRYLALVRGQVRRPGRIEAPIGRHPRDRKRMSVVARKRREAVTEYEPLEVFEGATLLLVRLLTGRTHQIRVHLAASGWPVVGDTVYGGRRQRRRTEEDDPLTRMPRQALHAWKIAFRHPCDGRSMELEAPLPEDFRRVLEELRERGKAC
ncbi:MAG: RluA family pseudouridine synthase [Candidatus Dadabacteria bacterium]|nr:MAG: RluA family pseudouridine synthase [Candidatus Dadabacteria bacterium]